MPVARQNAGENNSQNLHHFFLPHLEEETVGELDTVVGSGLDEETIPLIWGALQHSLDKSCL